jgi:putative redox protein
MVKSKSIGSDFHCTLTNGQLMLDSDAPVRKGGLGNGFRPHELLESALASCMNISVRMKAKQLNIPLTAVEITVNVQTENKDKTIFEYNIQLHDDLTNEQRDKLMNIISFCKVKETLTKELVFQKSEILDMA